MCGVVVAIGHQAAVVDPQPGPAVAVAEAVVVAAVAVAAAVAARVAMWERRLVAVSSCLGFRRTVLLDLTPEVRALPVVVKTLVAVSAGPLAELLRRIGECLFRREPLVRPPAREVLAISLKLVKLLARSSILLLLLLGWAAVSEILLHLGQLFPQSLGKLRVRAELCHRQPAVGRRISNNEVVFVVL